MVGNIRLSNFRYKLPKTAIAKYPADPRNASRMMVLNRKTGEIQNKKFVDIISLFQRGDVIVLNETKVFPAKIYGIKEKTNAEIEVLMIRKLPTEEANLWDAIVEPARKVREGNRVFCDGNNFYFEVIGNTTSRGRIIKLSYKGDLHNIIERKGKMAIPEYLDRAPENLDKIAYQTEFANDAFLNSIAPPTAGLHFTSDMLKQLEKKGVKIAKINLTLGQTVFEKISTEDLGKHNMHHEYYEIPIAAAETINKALKANKNICAVGCSVVRALESSVLTTGQLKPNKDWANKFIFSPFNFRIVTRLLTNFHPPASSSLILAATFGDTDNVLKAYRKAIKDNYRFYCYGDAMFII